VEGSGVSPRQAALEPRMLSTRRSSGGFNHDRRRVCTRISERTGSLSRPASTTPRTGRVFRLRSSTRPRRQRRSGQPIRSQARRGNGNRIELRNAKVIVGPDGNARTMDERHVINVIVRRETPLDECNRANDCCDRVPAKIRVACPRQHRTPLLSRLTLAPGRLPTWMESRSWAAQELNERVTNSGLECSMSGDEWPLARPHALRVVSSSADGAVPGSQHQRGRPLRRTLQPHRALRKRPVASRADRTRDRISARRPCLGCRAWPGESPPR
jgi:hypothetical protein